MNIHLFSLRIAIPAVLPFCYPLGISVTWHCVPQQQKLYPHSMKHPVHSSFYTTSQGILSSLTAPLFRVNEETQKDTPYWKLTLRVPFISIKTPTLFYKDSSIVKNLGNLLKNSRKFYFIWYFKLKPENKASKCSKYPTLRLPNL